MQRLFCGCRSQVTRHSWRVIQNAIAIVLCVAGSLCWSSCSIRISFELTAGGCSKVKVVMPTCLGIWEYMGARNCPEWNWVGWRWPPGAVVPSSFHMFAYKFVQPLRHHHHKVVSICYTTRFFLLPSTPYSHYPLLYTISFFSTTHIHSLLELEPLAIARV